MGTRSPADTHVRTEPVRRQSGGPYLSVNRVVGFAAPTTALIALCLVTTGPVQAAAWCLIGVVCSVAICAGVRLNRPVRRLPWWLAAGAIASMSAGDAVAVVAGTDQFNQTPPVPTTMCYLAMFPMLAAGVLLLTRSSSVLRDRSNLLVMLGFVTAVALSAWVLVVGPGLRADDISTAERSMMASYVLGDLLLLVVTARLLLAATGTYSAVMLATGSIGLLSANVLYMSARLGSSPLPRDVSLLGYLLFMVTCAAAALHRDMRVLSAPAECRPTPANGAGTTWLLRICLLVPPCLLVRELNGGRVGDCLVIAAACIATGELFLAHLGDTVDQHRDAIRREHVLRDACGYLLGAVNADMVAVAVRHAVIRLMPAGTHHGTVLVTMPNLDVIPMLPDERVARLVPVRHLHPLLGERFDVIAAGAADTALVCPLLLGGQINDLAAGALIVVAGGRALATNRDAIEVLAAQASLALERIALTDLVDRADGDRYLHSVVDGRSDVVVVLDEEDRVRYASPTVAGLLGSEPSLGAHLADLVDPLSCEQVASAKQRSACCGDPGGIEDRWTIVRPDGTRILVEVSYRDLRRDRLIRGFVITLRDVTHRRTSEQQRIRQALEHSGGWLNRQSSLSKFR